MFPFDLVVVSFPDADSAQAASRDLESMLGWLPCPWRATTDPCGIRVGSGGATLDAIRNHISSASAAEASASAAENPSPENDGSLLLILAGGESSRAPTQMVLGKAWTSLPTLQKVECDNASSSSSSNDESPSAAEAALTTPLVVGVRQMGRIMEGLPRGSVVVVAGDTLLRLPETIRWLSKEDESDADPFHARCQGDVIGVAVLAPFETAQNHGVYVMEHDDTAETEDVPELRPCFDVMQKPSVEQLHRAYPNSSSNEAWIDTGIVIFMPHVVASLRHLAHQHLDPIDEQQPPPPSSPPPSPTKLDLYTHILQALRTTSSEPEAGVRRSRYCQSSLYKPTDARLASAVFDALVDFSLDVWCLPGDFLHLGTSKELADFLISAAATIPNDTSKATSPTAANTSSDIRRRVGQSLGLVRRCQAYTEHVAFEDTQSVVASHVVLKRRLDANRQASNSCFKVGSRTVLEHCIVEVPGGRSVTIGSDCLVSGLRYYRDSHYVLRIPDRTVVHMVAHAKEDDASTGFPSTFLVVLGLDDDVKARTTLFGRPFQDVMAWSDLSEEDLWSDGIPLASRSLWNAKLHEVMDPRRCTRTVFDWLEDFLQSGQSQKASKENLQSVAAWKSADRRSLSEIRDAAGTAAAEFEFRRQLNVCLESERCSYFENLSSVLCSGSLEPLDWRWIVDDFAATGSISHVQRMLNTLDHVMLGSLRDSDEGARFGVCGRACRVSGAFLRDLLDGGCPPAASESESILGCGFTVSSFSVLPVSTLLSKLEEYVHRRNDSLSRMPTQTCRAALSIIDEVAQLMTERCIFGDAATATSWRARDGATIQCPVVNQWVVASAPARIDLAGGWTDTPPICFEYGSFVTGIAVLVDGTNPLSCSCRIVPGAKGILLQAESRGMCSGGLLSSAIAVKINTLADLADFRNPSSDCSLLKCALILLGLMPPDRSAFDAHSEVEFQRRINEFCMCDETVGLEIVASSLLPHGSGLGTSSILGGCVIASVQSCIRGSTSMGEKSGELIDLVLKLEQLMTTGGGFQDQVQPSSPRGSTQTLSLRVSY
jgi:L-fucokinase